MNKANVFKSKKFYMGTGDVCHILIVDETGSQVSVELYGASGVAEATNWGDLRDYDGNLYTEVVIGTQRWIVENLRTTHYADGTLIPNLTLAADWIAEDGSVGHDGAWCYYNNDISYLADYGLLYNGWAVQNSKGLVYFERDGVQELGWRVPTLTDWQTLRTYLGGEIIAGAKLKEIGTDHWTTPNSGATNSSGFTALGAGYRESNLVVGFTALKDNMLSWSQTYDTYPYDAWSMILYYDSISAIIWNAELNYGLSVRCVKDVASPFLYDYDDNQYTVITIGNQQWILENLKTTHYADGTAIPNLTNSVTTGECITAWEEYAGLEPDMFISVGKDITSLVHDADINGQAIVLTNYSSDSLAVGDIINISLNLNVISGSIPIVKIVKLHGSVYDLPVLVNGANAINYTVTSRGEYALWLYCSTGTFNFSMVCSMEVTNGWLDDIHGAYCWYNNNEAAYKDEYGALYNWYAVNNAHELAYLKNDSGVRQTGWRVPSKADFDTLMTYLGGESVAGGKMKEAGLTHWTTPNTAADNSSGFTALGGGYRYDDASFVSLGEAATFHSSTEYDATINYARALIYTQAECVEWTGAKLMGFSVRLVKSI